MNTPKFLYKLDVGKGDKPINGADSTFTFHRNSIFVFENHYYQEKSKFHFGKTSFSTKSGYIHVSTDIFKQLQSQAWGSYLDIQLLHKISPEIWDGLAWKIKCFWFWV